MKNFFQSLFLTGRLFLLLGADIALFVMAQFFPVLFLPAIGLLAGTGLAVALDAAVLFRVRKGIAGERITGEKLSNGDENRIRIELENYYNFPVHVEVIDEAPFQFQRRDIVFRAALPSGSARGLDYTLRPTKRGEYAFGALNTFVASPLGLVRRRFRFDVGKVLPVYPSFLQMRQYELMAANNRLTELGVKRVRRLGQSMEFEQIREYVVGDDLRSMNWKASARAGRNMVNQFIEEKSQPVYCIIDKGRMMRMPFKGMTLLDYAINASLVICNIAIHRQDRAGLITFAEQMGVFAKANHRPTQMNVIMELLYNQKTRYLESDFELLYSHIRRKVSQRSLLLLFTNFDSLGAMRRQLPYLRRLNRDHLLVVVFFHNTELRELILAPATNLDQVYLKTIAEKFDFEKRQIVKELSLHGIQAILSTPEDLTINSLNKYLEMKARGLI